MKTIFKKFLSQFFLIFRFYYRNRLIVLAYHDISNKSFFESHLRLIRRYYTPVTIQMVEDFLQRRVPLPPYSLLVTLDDGDPTVMKDGLPLFRKYEIPATAFIISENIRSQQKFWWRIVEDYYLKMGKRYSEARTEINRLKKASNDDRLKTFIEIKEKEPGLLRDPSALTIGDLRVMEKTGITIGSHTATHPILNQCNEHELESEFNISKMFFEESGIKTFKYFAYPNGDFSETLVPILKKFGIVLAFAFDHRINKKDIQPYSISRIRANSTDSLTEFKIRISGISSLFNK